MPTIVLIHGAWMNPESWQHVKERYERRGYTVHAPAWPHDDRPVAALRQSPDPGLVGIGVQEIVAHYEQFIRGLSEVPILIGHSFGGLFVQMLLDRGLGKAGVAIDPAPPKGVLPSFDALRASWPVASTFGFGKKVFSMRFEDFQWGWVHTLAEAEQRAAWERFVVPTPGKVFEDAALSLINSKTEVNFLNHTRAPLMIFAGEADRTVSASMNRANYKCYAKSRAVTAFREWPGRTHWLMAQPGWEEIADTAIEWVEGLS